jgi:hypothetical protein
MSLDIIVILALAIAFFGGLGYIAWKNQHEQKDGQSSSSAAPNPVEGDSPDKSQGKGRRISKS